MNKKKLVISNQAIIDLKEIWLYIANDSENAADSFIDYLYGQCNLLKETPDLGRKREDLLPGIRCIVAKRYLIFYRIKDDIVEIIRILNGYRDINSLF